MYTYLSVFAVYLFFYKRGGPAYVLQPTFGYLIGFLIGTFVTGLIVHKVPRPSIKRLLVANFSGLLIVYTLGTIYYFFIAMFYTNTYAGVWSLFLYCFLLPMPGDILTCVVCAFIGKRLVPILKRRNYPHEYSTNIKRKALQGVSITKEEALSLADQPLDELCQAANELREYFCDNVFDFMFYYQRKKRQML